MITHQSSLPHPGNAGVSICSYNISISSIHFDTFQKKKKPISIWIFMKEENPNNPSTKKMYHPDRNHSRMIIDNAKPLRFHHFSIPSNVTKQDECTIHVLSSSLYPSIEVVIQSHLLKPGYRKGRAFCRMRFC